MGILDFLALPGQERTRRRDEYLGGLLNYYLGPTGIPERLGLVDMMNPVSDVGRAMTSSQEMLAPGRTPMERVGAGATMLTDMAGVAAPMVATRMAGGDATQSMVEGLLGIGGQTARGLDDAARRFAADESGALTLWHGSPHDFDRFSMDKIGTGEGAQAYGHGLYFAESPDVARAYRDTITKNQSRGQGVSARTAIAEAFQSSDLADTSEIDAEFLRGVAMSVADGDAELAAEIAQMSPSQAQSLMGRLYEVSVDANPEDFLDWDAPLSAQPQRVREAISTIAPPKVFHSRLADEYRAYLEGPGGIASSFSGATRDEAMEKAMRGLTGENIIRSNVPSMISRELREAGIPGIRYLDAGSRGAGEGSRNYVVFDENLISIIRKYGIAGAAAMLGMSQADLAQAMEQQQQPQGLLGGPR